MKCDNCSSDAVYTIDPKIANPVNFCVVHLPEPYRLTAATGVYDIAKPEPAKSSKKKAPEEAPTEPSAE